MHIADPYLVVAIGGDATNRTSRLISRYKACMVVRYVKQQDAIFCYQVKGFFNEATVSEFHMLKEDGPLTRFYIEPV